MACRSCEEIEAPPAEQQLAAARGVRTLADVAARWRIGEVIVQDEFSHDVIVPLPDRRALVFDAT